MSNIIIIFKIQKKKFFQLKTTNLHAVTTDNKLALFY